MSLFISASNGLLNLMIYQEKKSFIIMLITFGGAVTNIMINLILIPWLGILGAALSSLATFSSLFFISYVYARKCYFIPFAWSKILSLIIVYASVIYLFSILPLESLIGSLLIKCCFLVLIIILIYKNNESLRQFSRMLGIKYFPHAKT